MSDFQGTPSDPSDRARAVADLVAFRGPIRDLIGRVGQFPWDCDDELVRVSKGDVVAVLRRYLEGELGSGDVEAWADAVEMRDDLGFAPGVMDVLFQMSSPEINKAITPQWANVLMRSCSRMGYSQSWLAVKGKPPIGVLEVLGVRCTGTREEIAESPIVGAELPGGWYLVVAGESGHRMMREETLQRLSAGCEVVTGDVEEHAMVSAASGWEDGRRVWSVTHDAQLAVEHLQAEGELPAVFFSVRDRLLAEQELEERRDVDYIFDVPVELARALTGYRHDAEVPVGGENPFEVLEETAPNEPRWTEKPSFLKRLFGR